MSEALYADVTIVGAGPVGLSLAIELGRRGVSCVVVEQHDRVGYNPRAKLTNTRTREHLRRWGIADELRKASPIPRDYPPRVVFATRLDGYTLAVFENALNCSIERDDASSENAQWVPQYTLEAVLREHVARFPHVSVRFNSRLVSLAQSDGSVAVEIVDSQTGEQTRIDSAYTVGADGARSTVRELLGLRLEGSFGLATFFNIVFESPGLDRRHDLGRAIQYWFVNRELSGVLSPMDDGSAGRWYFGVPVVPGGPDVTVMDPRLLLRACAGIDVPLTLISSETWASHAGIARTYRDGRVFLAGDACHIHPPFGGYGMNMGIGDAVDLGWKLGATLAGWGGPALLDSYEIERRPVHLRVLNEAVENQKVLGPELVADGIESPGPEGDAVRVAVGERIRAAKRREFDTLGVVLGVGYEGSPLVVDDRSDPVSEDFSTYVPSSRPGALAPHGWLTDGSSIYDHFGPGFTLIVHEADRTAEIERLVAAARRRRVPLDVFAPDDERIALRYGTGLALVRPDQHIAWRGDRIDDADAVIARAVGAKTFDTALSGGR